MIKLNLKNKKTKSGYSLIELIFYISIFSIISIVIINSMIVTMKSFKETTIQAELLGGGKVMERMSREVRNAYDIVSIDVNELTLNTKDDTDSEKIVKFVSSGTNLELWENDVFTGNLNTSNLALSDLVFTLINTTEGKAVKISFTVSSNHDSLNRLQNFYNTVVLRGSY